MTQTGTATAIQTFEFPERDKYGRSTRLVYGTRPGAQYGQIAVIVVMPKTYTERYGKGQRYMVTDRRREVTPFRAETHVTHVATLALARAEVARIAALPVGTPAR